MPNAPKDTAIRKRQQILDSSKKMFIWVAGASVIIGFALVVSWFLMQQIAFKDKVINEKNKTVSSLESNNKVAPKLAENIRVLDTNEALRSARMNDSEKAIQVILDALPADDNKLALGASIQNKLVGDAQNVRIETFSVGKDLATSKSKTKSTTKAANIPFQLAISSDDPNALKDVMKRFEQSIRTIDVDMLLLERSDTRMTLTVTGHAYYMPAAVIKLDEKVVKP